MSGEDDSGLVTQPYKSDFTSSLDIWGQITQSENMSPVPTASGPDNMSSTYIPSWNSTGTTEIPTDPDHLQTTVIPWILASFWILVWVGLILLGVFVYLYRKSQIEKIIAKRKRKKEKVEAIIDSARKVKHSESDNSVARVNTNSGQEISGNNSVGKMQETSLGESNNNAVYLENVVVNSIPNDSNLTDELIKGHHLGGKFNGGYQVDTVNSNPQSISKC